MTSPGTKSSYPRPPQSLNSSDTEGIGGGHIYMYHRYKKVHKPGFFFLLPSVAEKSRDGGEWGGGGGREGVLQKYFFRRGYETCVLFLVMFGENAPLGELLTPPEPFLYLLTVLKSALALKIFVWGQPLARYFRCRGCLMAPLFHRRNRFGYRTQCVFQGADVFSSRGRSTPRATSPRVISPPPPTPLRPLSLDHAFFFFEHLHRCFYCT